MRSKNNTKQGGVARIFIFPQGKSFKAVCLDFDIIEEAKTLEKVKENINEAVKGYIINICKNNLDDALLNRHADEKYWIMVDKYSSFINAKANSRVHVTGRVKASALLSMPLNAFAPSFC